MKKGILPLLIISSFLSLTGCNNSIDNQENQESHIDTPTNQVQWEASKFEGNIAEIGISENIQSIAIQTKSKYIAIDSQSADGQAVLTYVNDILTDHSSIVGATDGAFLINHVGEPLDYLSYEMPYLAIFLKAPQEYDITVTDMDGYHYVISTDVYAISFDLRSSEVCFLDSEIATYGYCFLESFGFSSSFSSQELSDLSEEILSRKQLSKCYFSSQN